MSIELVDGGKSLTEENSNCTQNYENKDSDENKSYKNIAFIIPYRDRLDNLKIFLNNMHPFLTRQKINYGIYLIEPVKDIKFNRALLMNIGFLEAQKDAILTQNSFEYNNNVNTINNNNNTNNLNLNKIKNMKSFWNCFVFHDVDMINEDVRVEYKCDKNYPMHYAVAVSKFGYSTTGYFAQYFGGINSFTKSQFIDINGFSNMYFGWGISFFKYIILISNYV